MVVQIFAIGKLDILVSLNNQALMGWRSNMYRRKRRSR